MKKTNFLLGICAIVLLCTNCSGTKIQVNGMQSSVRSIISGKEIELQNGTKVVLLGVKDSENSKKYLEQHVKGKRVTIISDSKQPQFISTYLTTIYAYVRVNGEKGCVQNKLLQTRLTKANTALRCDSLASFIEACKVKRHPIMSSSELLTYMKPATFLVMTENGCGTGFYINNNGLALTNNHVWDGSTTAQIALLTDNGDFDISNTRAINRVVATYKDGNIDFTIFVVQLEGGERSAYLPLVDQHIPLGEPVAKLGCALAEAANYNTGVLSKYDEGSITHSINTNNGDSGSPICNMRGEVIGIHVASRRNLERNETARGLSYGTDALVIKQVLDNLGIEYGR